jgi:hypothetical protein
MQRHNGGHGKLGALGNQKIRRYFDIRGGVKLDVFQNVIAFVNSFENPGHWVARRGSIQEQIENFRPSLGLPGFKVFGADAQVSEAREGLFLHLLDEGVETA